MDEERPAGMNASDDSNLTACCTYKEYEAGYNTSTCCRTEDGANGTGVANETTCCTTLLRADGSNDTSCCNYTVYEDGTNATNCTGPYAGHWQCVDCDPEDVCEGRAEVTVPNEDSTMCLCTNCTYNWTGYNCSTCDYPYGGDDCNCCAEGLVGYPACRECSAALDCSGNAHGVVSSQVSANDTCLFECQCECRNGWYGADCGACPELMDPEEDCGACLFAGEYPHHCLPNCTADPGHENCTKQAVGLDDEDDESCWTPFKGWCFILAAVMGACCVCTVLALALMQWKRRRDEMDDAPLQKAVGGDGFDKLCAMVEDQMVEMAAEGDNASEIKSVKSLGETTSSRSDPLGNAKGKQDSFSGMELLLSPPENDQGAQRTPETRSIRSAKRTPQLDPLGKTSPPSRRWSGVDAAKKAEDPLLAGAKTRSGLLDVDDDRFAL
eukprot:TRINITY_DN1336_c1_g1_i1.p1 TRINITY_DN1336_c1_g1~~TRINITY_DN1336_c1_g1_i1.p1  ORF type:complete len:439 (+),score=158.62 TRINITY_DN1336_c1_g1_i1:1224-2540(+)